jgi:chemotaxis protein MotB
MSSSKNPLSPPPKHEEHEDWLLTFADMVVILMCFFIMLFALTYVPEASKKTFLESLTGTFSGDNAKEEDSFVALSKSVLTLNGGGYDAMLFVTQNEGKVEIELASSAFFASGSAQFKKDAIPALTAVAGKLTPFLTDESLRIQVEGHTDDTPIATAQFPSNWELSGARASNVVRFLIAKGIDAKLLVAMGFADVKPKAENRDTTGEPIAANQELNRRVVITIQRAG